MTDTITITDKNDVVLTDIVTLRKGKATIIGPQFDCMGNIHIRIRDRNGRIDACTDDGWEFVSATREVPSLPKLGTFGTIELNGVLRYGFAALDVGSDKTIFFFPDEDGSQNAVLLPDPTFSPQSRYVDQLREQVETLQGHLRDALARAGEGTHASMRLATVLREAKTLETDLEKASGRLRKANKAFDEASEEVRRLKPALDMAISDRNAWKEKWEDNEATLARVESVLARWKESGSPRLQAAADVLIAEMEREDEAVEEQVSDEQVAEEEKGEWPWGPGDVLAKVSVNLVHTAEYWLNNAPVGVIIRDKDLDLWVKNVIGMWLNLDGGSSWINTEYLAQRGPVTVMSVPMEES